MSVFFQLRDLPEYRKEGWIKAPVRPYPCRGGRRAALRRDLREHGALYFHNRKARRARGLSEVSR